jgi:hypothetical protein
MYEQKQSDRRDWYSRVLNLHVMRVRAMIEHNYFIP